MHSPQMFAQTRCVILERDVYVTGVAGSLWRRRFVSLGTVTGMRMYSSVNNGSNIIVFI